MLEFGATRVELGVQILDDEIYRLTRRGHSVEDVVRATALLRENGFKVHYHLMPGLPGSTPEHDLELSRKLFEDERFKPDGLKLYPTMVVEGTELEKWYREKRYQPYEISTMVNLMADIKSIVPKYVRISRVLRDIPAKYITAGCKDSLRGVVKQRMKRKGMECQCIRCREYGHRAREGRETGEPRLTRMDYEAAGGKEVFLSFEDETETLFGLLRMRIQPNAEGGNAAVIRELHIYGPEVPLTEQREGAAQHKGLGKALLLEAERIAADEFKAPQMTILSGIGAREYYRSEFGYSLQGAYMVKELQVTAPRLSPP
jgi:elongator complex protein 3